MTMTDDDTDELADLAEPDEIRLPGNRCTVTLAGGHAFTVRITNRDHIAWDKTAPKRKWGQARDVPFLAGTFMAWTAAKRDGLTVLTWDQWQEAVDDIEMLAEEVDDLVRPTRPGVRPDSS